MISKAARRLTFGRIKRDLLRAIAAGRSGDAVNHLALGVGQRREGLFGGVGRLVMEMEAEVEVEVHIGGGRGAEAG